MLCLGIARGAAAWQAADGPGSLALQDGSERAALLATLAGKAAAARATIVVSGTLARHWLQAPPPGLRSFAELRAFVESRAEQLFGAGGWSVMADWQARQAFLCAAVPRWVADLAEALVPRHAQRRVVTTALGCTPLQSRRSKALWRALHEPGVVHVGRWDGGRCESFGSVMLNEAAERGSAMPLALQEARRLAALRGDEAPAAIELQATPVGTAATAACKLAVAMREGAS